MARLNLGTRIRSDGTLIVASRLDAETALALARAKPPDLSTSAMIARIVGDYLRREAQA